MYSTSNSLLAEPQLAQLSFMLGLLHSKPYRFALDSRKVQPGVIFCAYPGSQSDGRDFIPAAIANGASAILWEPGIEFNYPIPNQPLPHLQQYVGILAALAADFPSQHLTSLAITGTNGKTSISHWLNQAYALQGRKSSIIGTTGAGVYPQVSDYSSTTPDPITLQHLVASFVAEQVEVLAMEASSHALVQGRVNGMWFKRAIFTNLTQDHLDYHHTMEEYYQAKRMLFFWQGLEMAIINHDDHYGQRLLSELRHLRPQLNLLSYGIDGGDLCAQHIELSGKGLSFELKYANLTQKVCVPVIGRFNIYNLLAVAANLLADGVSLTKVAQLLPELRPVRGRMDTQLIAGKPLVVVDFAHTPDALLKALQTLAEIKRQGRLICVFGCGGNRDRDKRPKMGKVAASYADLAIVTSDNPRFEDPLLIIQEITAGMNNANFQVISERRQAISTALKLAQANDIVLIAGKGHENYQEINGVKYHLDDLELVTELLNG